MLMLRGHREGVTIHLQVQAERGQRTGGQGAFHVRAEGVTTTEGNDT